MSDREMWERRFSGESYVFGREPNAFLAAQSGYLTPGMKALSLADGEGRNGVWMARQGLAVTATDFSGAALAKAARLAAEAGVDIDLVEEDIGERQWLPDSYDLVAAIFIQFAGPALRAKIFDGIRTALRPGGLLLLQGYRPEQLAYGTGGPRQLDNLYTADLLREAFDGFEVLKLEEHVSELAEGAGHCGLSALVDLVARKPG